MRRLLFLVTTMLLMVQGASAWNGSGSSGDPYLIASPADWETFATSTDEYSDTFFKLTADITVTTMRTKTFKGTLDGGGHTLTFNYTATGDNAAPFAYITGATIKNLRVAGTINTGYKFAAGIAAQTDGTTNITNCQVSVTINSNDTGKDRDGTHGGLVAYQGSGTLTINNCLFDGELLGASTSGCGGFVGWVANSSGYQTNISNSLFAPANITVTAYTFCRQNKSTLHLEASTCYYITPNWTASTVQGTNAGSKTTASLVTALNNGGTNWCNNGGKATPILIFDYIGNQSNWNAFTSGINAGINYSDKTVKMSADFTATTMVTATFSGTFDGGGHTLTFNYTATGNNAAPFAYITGATIKNLRVAGTINSGYKFAAGIVAISNGGTITNCQSSVTINSSKSEDGTHGGLVADSYTGTLNITNCLFDGKLLGTTTTSCGGIVGWHNSNSTLYISNSLFAPAEVTVQGQGGAIIARDGANSLSNLSNCYYISDWSADTDQGTNANSMTAEALVAALNNGDKNWCIHRGNAIPVMVNLVINNKTEWDNFSSHAGNYENKYVQLNADITNITAKISNAFQGIFDGNGHKLTVNLSGEGNMAPFQYLDGGTIMNLTVTGTVTGGANYCSGLVARTSGGVCLIDNCVVNTNNNGVGYVGGVVAHADNATSLTISNCIYGGTIAIQPNGNENYSGGILGWYNKDKTLDLVMTNCLFKGDYTGNGQFHPIGVKKWAGIFKSFNCTNCYYTKNPANIDGPDRFFTDGTKVCVYDADPGIMGTVTKEYSNTGYKVYEKGVSYGGKFYTAVVAMTEDGITDLTAYAGQTIDVAFGRSFDALGTSTGTVHAATVCLPFSFAMPGTSVGKFYTFDGVTGSGDDYTVTMTEVSGTEITAGTPYMFVPAGSGGAAVFENAAFTVPSEGFAAAGKTEDGDGWAFTGTYTKLTWASGQTRLYGFAGTNFKTGDGSALNDIGAFRRFDYGTTAAFRCYLMAPGTAGTRGSGAALPESMRVVLKGADGSITGIGTIDTMTGEATLDGNGPWYTLGGQYLQGKPSRPGIYIHNGKKVVIK